MTEESSDTKTCPFCAETIKDAAIVCKHCGRDVATAVGTPAISAEASARLPMIPIGIVVIVVAALLLIASKHLATQAAAASPRLQDRQKVDKCWSEFQSMTWDAKEKLTFQDMCNRMENEFAKTWGTGG